MQLSEAVRWYRRAADQGEANAEYGLAFMYHEGKGVSRDDAEAARWYRKAAEQGDEKAQCSLAASYAEGKGVPQDYAESVRWYRKAGDQGDSAAQSYLAYVYLQGQGVPKDYAEAARWYLKAAEKGDATAQYGIGYMYRNGSGVPRDYAEAYRWLGKAADQGEANALSVVGYSKTTWKLRYLTPLIVFLGGLLFLLDFLRPGQSLRDWRQIAKTLFGVSNICWVGLTLLGLAHMELRYTACSNALSSAKGMFEGISVALCICLVLTMKKTGGGGTPIEAGAESAALGGSRGESDKV
jgi:TPR repeat protein